MQINIQIVLTGHSEIYFHQSADKTETLELYALFTDQSGYSIVRPRTDDVPAERLVSCTTGEASLLKYVTYTRSTAFMSDIQTPPILEHQRTMVSDQMGTEAQPLSCPLGA
jgi:hypothetical protein